MSNRLFAALHLWSLWGGMICFGSGALWAQPMLHPEPEDAGRVRVRSLDSLIALPADTLIFSRQSPFFDDFSYRLSHPDPERWALDTSRANYPLLTRGMAIEPPSWGVATFDGTDAHGRPFNEEEISAGPTDQLRSHYMDLSGLLPRDNIYLSFYLQARGRGNAPDPDDSFSLYFAVDSFGNQFYIQAWSIKGSELAGQKQFVVPVHRRSYFHKGFQMVFQAEGSQNGYLDHWHLDYVYMAADRSPADTLFEDYAVAAIEQPLLYPYSRAPWALIQSQLKQLSPVGADLSYLGSRPISVDLQQVLSGPVLPKMILEEQVDFSPYAHQHQLLRKDWNWTGSNPGGNLQYGLDLLGADMHPENNRVDIPVGVDSVLAYDDGEADASYGLSQRRGFGSLFHLGSQQAAVMPAVWIHFVPRLNFNPVANTAKFMENEPFRLVIWNAPHPDSILYQQIGNLRVAYGDSLNQFQRYGLNEEVVLPDSFWVGIQQLTDQPIGLGFDLSYNRDPYMYWDSAGVWTPSRLGGSFMIRPEIRFSGMPVPREETIEEGSLVTWPKPVSRFGELQIIFERPEIWQGYRLEIKDLQGRTAKQLWRSPASGAVKVPLEGQLAPGYYYLMHTLTAPGREAWHKAEKCLVY